jgi:hypothetical protein
MATQPAREPHDGQVSVTREGECLRVTVTHNGESASVLMGEFNAWRIFGMLAMMLEISLPTALLKKIKM